MFTIHPAFGTVTRDSDGKVVSPAQSTEDSDYREYIDWVGAGNQPTVDDTQITPVPPAVTPCQFRLALNKMGLRKQIEAAVDAADQDTQDLWHYGNVIERNNPQLNEMATQLGITQEQVDQVFVLAGTLA